MKWRIMCPTKLISLLFANIALLILYHDFNGNCWLFSRYGNDSTYEKFVEYASLRDPNVWSITCRCLMF